MEKRADSQDFDRKKTAYAARFAVSHLSAFRPHFRHGETLGKGPEVWRNVSEHCLVAGIFADILAEELNLDKDQRDNVVNAAILHDWYKKFESLAQGKARREGSLSLETLDAILEEDSKALMEMGVSETIIEIIGSNVPESLEGPDTVTGKIFWYVDAMLSNTEPVAIQQRFDDLERGWDGEREDPERATRNNAFSDIYRSKYLGRSLYEVQRQLGDIIGTEFSDALGFRGEPANLPYYLKDKFVERVVSS